MNSNFFTMKNNYKIEETYSELQEEFNNLCLTNQILLGIIENKEQQNSELQSKNNILEMNLEIQVTKYKKSINTKEKIIEKLYNTAKKLKEDPIKKEQKYQQLEENMEQQETEINNLTQTLA